MDNDETITNNIKILFDVGFLKIFTAALLNVGFIFEAKVLAWLSGNSHSAQFKSVSYSFIQILIVHVVQYFYPSILSIIESADLDS